MLVSDQRGRPFSIVNSCMCASSVICQKPTRQELARTIWEKNQICKILVCSDEDVALSDPSEQGDSEEDRSDDVRSSEAITPIISCFTRQPLLLVCSTDYRQSK